MYLFVFYFFGLDAVLNAGLEPDRFAEQNSEGVIHLNAGLNSPTGIW